MNNWVDYQSEAAKTAVYPKKLGIVYTALGLVDESKEFMDALGSDNQVKELGDCFWYFANLSRELEINLGDIQDTQAELEDQFPFDTAEEAAGQMLQTGAKICGIIKKYIRDEKNKKPSDDKITQLEFELAWYLGAMYIVVDSLGTTWQDVAEKNLEKLFSRKDRGKLNGSGDSR